MRKKRFLCMAAAVLTVLFCCAFSSKEVHAASSARLSKKSVTMTAGEKYRLRMRNIPKNATMIWTSSNERRATVSPRGVVRAKKAGTVKIRATAAYRQNGKEKTARLSCRIKIRNYKSVKGKKLKMSTKNTEVIITLNGSKAAADLVAMLPLELRLIERNRFAKGMELPKQLSSGEATTRDYEIGDFGYWNAGPDLAIFYDDIYKKTIVRVIPLGHASSGAEALAHEKGKVRLELVN